MSGKLIMDRQSPLNEFHAECGARMISFAGWSLPVQYSAGLIAEHQACREKAALFDVSHMGQFRLSGHGAAEFLESLTPGDALTLKVGRSRYTVLTNDDGGIIDDLIISRLSEDSFYLVVNGARRDVDKAHLQDRLPASLTLHEQSDKALLAIQGPLARQIMADFFQEAAKLPFMQMTSIESADYGQVMLFCQGYSGEDGFELSIDADKAPSFARQLTHHPDCTPAGLGARDSLRLEAGLPLYGQDLDMETSPVEAGLAWIIPKRRRVDSGDKSLMFPGANRILSELAHGPSRQRVGFFPEGRAPARAGVEIIDKDERPVGIVTSGGFSPSLSLPVSMGYIASPVQEPYKVRIRDRLIPVRLQKLPFVAHRYYRS